MNHQEQLTAYLAGLRDEQVLPLREPRESLGAAHLLEIEARDWGRAAACAAALGWRWAGGWADQRDGAFALFALLESGGAYLLLATRLPLAALRLPSQAGAFPAAARMERHIQDMHGIVFADHPDPRRWIRHRAWPEGSHPLRDDFPLAGEAPERTGPDNDYPFQAVQGSGVYEIPVGPVHAGIIEPGHFRFQAVGEMVLRLEARLGYVHKGVEKIAVGRDAASLARLAGRVSGDSTVAHSWAACQALEQVAGMDPAPRALALRALLAERERVANHLGDIGAICNDVGFAFAFYQFSRLREDWQRRSAELFGHRLLMDVVVPGGLVSDVTAQTVPLLTGDHAALRTELTGLYDILLDHPALEDRLLNTGRLSSDTARRLGCLGYVARASGLSFDVRRHSPYAPYDLLAPTVPCYSEGDVAARLRVRMDEILASLALLDELLEQLPDGEVHRPLVLPAGGGEGLGIVEGWRGEIVSYVRCDEAGRIARFFPRDPSWFNWPALEAIVLENIVPDFPVCNKSVNASYSGHDL
ncbi:MAG: NADH-quinone oxidoreductase subunit C [Gammaproteobacteria bacterium]